MGMERNIECLVRLTTGQYNLFVTAETASFDSARTSASAVLAGTERSFEQLYSTEVYVAVHPSSGLPVTNYRVRGIDHSQTALEAAYVLSSSFA